ncbi:MAG: 16S rRNA (guanine(527)-N(7))-methyltransferase RsmG, partial [Lentisphaeria bacterium]|nr:16S rRNA (guanine(527)-N(7))-methyltransferase RsmG [Lentisphaeria bacterium]NQZ68336.1 16S rRNA (guanine(527)-N(7))-methyltransferase RsmG [Lentisphaeria bacterium]
HNLTRILDTNDFIIKQILDSLLLLKVCPELESLKIIDVGCGGGIPGVILAAYFPELAITELDSIQKKVTCVQTFIDSLSLKNAQTVCGNMREIARQDGHKEQYDLVIARAVTRADKLIKETRQFLNKAGRIILFKTPDQIDEEWELAEREAKKYKLSIQRSEIYDLPKNAGSRQFLIIS